MLDTSDQGIWDRTGIRERRVARSDESNACMAKSAAERALQASGITALDLDTIIVATCTPDRLLPSQACDLQALLGAKNAAAFDVAAACTGFIYALNVAEGLVATEQAGTVLVVASEKLTSIVDWTDRTTAVLFGDGAGATVIRPSSNGRGILSTYMKSDGTLADLLYRPAGGAAHPPDEQMLKDRSQFVQMSGREVFKAAVLTMADACDTALARAGITGADLDLLIPHQANIRIIEATAKHAGCRWKGVRQRGSLRQHLRRVGGDRARRGRPHRAADPRNEGDVRRVRRGLHMGEHGPPVVAPGKTVWLCPGQGAQKVGMGKDLAERFPAARLVFEAIEGAQFPAELWYVRGP
jgi:3-oxoacyl-[acyl-carrier-protein] synthase-3